MQSKQYLLNLHDESIHLACMRCDAYERMYYVLSKLMQHGHADSKLAQHLCDEVFEWREDEKQAIAEDNSSHSYNMSLIYN